jgi:hypothetical protein
MSRSLAFSVIKKTKRAGDALALVGLILARSSASRSTPSGTGRASHALWVRASRNVASSASPSTASD